MPRKDGRGRRVKKRTPVPEDPDAERAPKPLVFWRGSVSPLVMKVCQEWRETFLPYTAKELKVYRKEKLKNVTRAAKTIGATHFQVFTCSTTGTFLRVARLPHGPTIQFKVESFETCYDVKRTQRKPHEDQHAFDTPALPVLNNFANSTKPHIKMAQTLLTNLYPQLRVDKVQLANCKRVVLFHLNEDTDMIDVRHYVITGQRKVQNKAIKRLVKGKLPQRPGVLKDISDLLHQPEAFFSDSEGEAEEVQLGQRFRKLAPQSKALIKLVEVGPRFTLSIHKVLAGNMDGEVIYHSFVTKTPEEVAELKRRRKKREKERKARREEQERKVEEKQIRKDEKKRRREQRREGGAKEGEAGQPEDGAEADDESSEDEAPPAKRPLRSKGSDEEDEASQDDVGSADEDDEAPQPPKQPRFERMKERAHARQPAGEAPHGFQSGEAMFPRGGSGGGSAGAPRQDRKATRPKKPRKAGRR
eukprot:EG_transcript_8987